MHSCIYINVTDHENVKDYSWQKKYNKLFGDIIVDTESLSPP